jgi:hypothetical protein
MKVSTELVALLVILVFTALLLLAIRTSRNSREQKTTQASALGFEALSVVPDELVSRVNDLFRNQQTQSLSITEPYHQHDFERDLYIFDLDNTTGQDTEMGSEIFGVISRQLALPHFSLTSLPPFNTDNMLGNLMDMVLDKVLDVAEKYQGLKRIEFPDQPGYENQFVVFGQDEFAVLNMLDRVNLSALARSKNYLHLAGSGDFLTVDFSIPSTPRDPNRDFRAQYQEFLSLVRIFEED